MPNDVKLRLPEVVVPGKRLGRSIGHDLRSLRYLVPETATPVVAEHTETIGVLDQGNLGSCTGNALTHMLGTAEFDVDPKWLLDENFAVQRYGRATQVDPFDGTYPPTDSGSDGVSVCKAGQQDGFLSGYTHATSLAGCYTMIAARAFIIGINWYEGMDDPDVHGNVQIAGQVRGGHEPCVVARQPDGRWRVKNSWGAFWGDQGHFYLTDAQLTRLLSEQGDATQGVPVNVPAPTPTPVPPGPAPQPTDPAYVAWLAHAEPAYQYWLAHPIKGRRPLQGAIDAWIATVD